MSEDDLEALLKCAVTDDRFREFKERLAPDATTETSDGAVRVVSLERGLEIHADAEDGLVDALFLIVQPSPKLASGHQPFTGPLPYRIPPDAGHIDVAESIGRSPDRVTAQTDTWYQDTFRLVVSYRAGRIASLVAATRAALPVAER